MTSAVEETVSIARCALGDHVREHNGVAWGRVIGVGKLPGVRRRSLVLDTGHVIRGGGQLRVTRLRTGYGV